MLRIVRRFEIHLRNITLVAPFGIRRGSLSSRP